MPASIALVIYSSGKKWNACFMPQSHQDWVNTAATSKESSLTSGGWAFMQLNNKKISGSDNDCMKQKHSDLRNRAKGPIWRGQREKVVM